MNLSIKEIIDSHNFGKVIGKNIIPDVREDEQIVGRAAAEFSLEAKTHPERYRYIARMVARLCRPLRTPSIMDFGCGPGVLTTFIVQYVPDARILGVDLSADMLHFARENTKAHSMQFVQYNIRDVYSSTDELADVVVSRNMLHRITSLYDGLLSLARATKKGGHVLNISFRNVNDLNATQQQQWIRDFHERDNYLKLQEAWVLAYLNAPTLADYQSVAKQVAYKIDAKVLLVSPGRRNDVQIYLQK